MKPTNNKKSDELNLIDLALYLLSKWPWFVLSILLCVGVAWYKYASAPFVYFRTATIIIKDPESSNRYSASFDRYDNLINKVNVTNEIYRFQSKNLFRAVINRLNANISYKIKSNLRYEECYTTSPVTLVVPEESKNRSINFVATLKPEGGIELSSFSGAAETEIFVGKLNEPIPTPAGELRFTPTNFLNESWIDRPIYVSQVPVDAMAGYYLSNFAIRQVEQEAPILKLSLKDNSPIKAEDILNTIIAIYNEQSIKDKNQIAINTANFINERLIIIEQDLGSVEKDLEAFKISNQMINGVAPTAGRYESETIKYSQDVAELHAQLELAKYIHAYLTDPTKDVELIPANTGLSSANTEELINQYNMLKLRRDKLAEDGNTNNPVVLELNKNLHALKQTIVRTIGNLIANIEAQTEDLQSRERRAKARFQQIPSQERGMLSIERQQKLKEALYTFLLNKREENALTQSMVDTNAQIIEDTSGSNAPISPMRNRIILLGILVGLAIPAVWFLLLMFLDTRVHSRREIKNAVSVPIIGDIPQDKGFAKSVADGNVAPELSEILVESFRILRTNMNFMLKGEKELKVLTLTSFNESAGKTFVTTNLARSLANAQKKVLLIDADIRKGTLSQSLGRRQIGLTNYLADPTLTATDILHTDFMPNVDLVPAGMVAPNPSELLLSERLDELVAQMREIYDFIIIDNVPFGIIADGDISNRVADITLFVVRAGRLDRRQLPELEELYQEKKLRNMALIFNGSDIHRRGYGYGYGYGGYGYGGYGYGYGYGTQKKGLFSRFKK